LLHTPSYPDPTLLQLGVERKDLACVRRDLHGSAFCRTHRVITARRAPEGSGAEAAAARDTRGGQDQAANRRKGTRPTCCLVRKQPRGSHICLLKVIDEPRVCEATW
jgi:hypothetical protein